MPTIPTDPQGRLATAYLSWTDAAGNPQIFVPDLVLEEQWTGNATITENPVEQGANITDNIRVELRRVTLKFFLTNEPLEANNWTEVAFAPVTLDLPARTVAAPLSPVLAVPTWQSNLSARIAITEGGQAALGIAGGEVASLVTSRLLAGRVIEVPVTTDIGQNPPPAGPTSVGVNLLSPNISDDFVALSIQWLAQLKNAGQTMDVYGTKDSLVSTTPGLGAMAIEAFTWSRSQDDGTGATVSLGLKEIRVVATQTVPAPAASIPRAKAPVKGGNQQTNGVTDAAANAGKAFVQGFQDGSSDVQSLFSSGD